MNIQKIVYVLRDTVRQLRYKWDKNQDQFAKLLGLSQATVFKLENGNYDKLPKHETLIAIAEALNMPYWEFIRTLEQAGDAIDEGDPMSKYQIIASIVQLQDFEESFDVAQAALQRCQELRFQIHEKPPEERTRNSRN